VRSYNIIGKTGTGKSTLLETMALQDLEHGNGFALIDPHGDLAERVAAHIPSHVSRIPSTSTPPILPNRTATIRCARCDKNLFRSLPPV
jgi:anion-transporting  ArsA/GET3 family ATPase